MGTNFYWKSEGMDDDLEAHIGKRSASGMYCFDCGTTFCLGGTIDVHKTGPKWSDKCPGCGAKTTDEPLMDSAAGQELGFGKMSVPRKGVQSCASFTWSLMKHKWAIERLATNRKTMNKKSIVDEYGNTYSPKQFIEKVLPACPLQYQLPVLFS